MIYVEIHVRNYMRLNLSLNKNMKSLIENTLIIGLGPLDLRSNVGRVGAGLDPMLAGETSYAVLAADWEGWVPAKSSK